MTDWELYLYSTKNLITRHTVDNEIMDEFLMNMDFTVIEDVGNYKNIQCLN